MAVDRQTYEAVAIAAIARYSGCSGTPSLLSLSENATYRVGRNDATAVLRVHRPGYHTKAQIESELTWAANMHAAGAVNTAGVIASDARERVEVVSTPDGRVTCNCVMFEFLEGEEPPEDAIVREFERLGEVTARMHEFSRSWTPPERFHRLTWDFDTTLGGRPHWGRWRDGRGVDADAAEILQAAVTTIERRLADYGQDASRFGLVHADMRLANLLVTPTETSVIDFDDCGFSWYMYDLAAALSFIEDRSDIGEAVDRWQAGYARVATLDPDDVAIIPTMIMLRRILLVAWLGSHPTADLAADLGVPFTETTCDLARAYLNSHHEENTR
ncbi:phosphotransferase enzyme family protein [soil metagenome]